MIQINDKLRIISMDDLNLQLEELKIKTNPKTKEQRLEWCFVGYYPTLEAALCKVLTKSIIDLTITEEMAISDVIAKIEEVQNDIKRIKLVNQDL